MKFNKKSQAIGRFALAVIIISIVFFILALIMIGQWKGDMSYYFNKLFS